MKNNHYFWPCALVLSLLSLRCFSQSKTGFLIKGHIANSATKWLSVNSGKELSLFPVDRITVDSSGDFKCWYPQKTISGYFYLSDQNGFSVSGYTGQSDSVNIKWSDDNPQRTLNIRFGTLPEDKQLPVFLDRLKQIREEQEDALDTCRNAGDFLAQVSRLHSEENKLLKATISPMASDRYRSLAMDIFFRNLDLILNSKFYHNLDFSGLGNPVFPPIVLQDAVYESTLSASYDRMKKENPNTDTVLLKNASTGETKDAIRAGFSLIDIKAFQSSVEYRNFINDYFQLLARDMTYRRIGFQLSSNVRQFANWLRALTDNTQIADFLTSSMIENQILANKFGHIKELEAELSAVGKSDLSEELRMLWAQKNTLKIGMPAPDFRFLASDGTTMTLSSLKGAYVFLNIWDSACAPCIADISNYSGPVLKKYAGRNIKFIFLSLDRDDRTWKNVLRKISHGGINGRIVDGWKGSMPKDYSVFAIPRHIIISPDGKIADLQYDLLSALLEQDPFKNK